MVLDKTYTLKDLTYRISSSLQRNADDSGNSSYGTDDGYIIISIMEYRDDVSPVSYTHLTLPTTPYV